MRVRHLAYCATILLAGCSPSGAPVPPDAYARLTDRTHARFPIFKQYHDLCRQNGRRLPDRDCLRFDPPRRWSGVIVHNERTGNHFYPGRSSGSRWRSQQSTYLVAALPIVTGCRSPLCRPFQPDGSSTRPLAFAVEFIGRRTTVGGRYWHIGMFSHEILVDRMIRQRPLPDQ